MGYWNQVPWNDTISFWEYTNSKRKKKYNIFVFVFLCINKEKVGKWNDIWDKFDQWFLWAVLLFFRSHILDWLTTLLSIEIASDKMIKFKHQNLSSTVESYNDLRLLGFVQGRIFLKSLLITWYGKSKKTALLIS